MDIDQLYECDKDCFELKVPNSSLQEKRFYKMNQESLQDTSPPVQQNNADYMFSLKRVEPKQASKLDIEVSLVVNPGNVVQYPRLGPVRNYLLNAFYTCKQDQLEEPQNLVYRAIEFGHIMERELEEKEEMYLPSNPTRQCQVCRCSIDNYTEHIIQKEHIEKLHQSRGTRLIRELSATFQRRKASANQTSSEPLNTKKGQCIDCDEGDEGDEATQNERRLLLKDCERNDELLRQN